MRASRRFGCVEAHARCSSVTVDKIVAAAIRRQEGPAPAAVEQDAEPQQAPYAVNCPDSSVWVEPLQNSVLSAGGTVGSVAGALVSTLNDFARLCLMIQNGGELGGVRLLTAP